ncbi:ABC transporter [Actinoplanes cyaneus]|uniref:ABC transporter n=2 Tax=Actinoplanes cyaneus TaxID=52696 RepID=A0A919IWU0_9ACTN|nr:ABC transporter [Actinoplanes cyaneus]
MAPDSSVTGQSIKPGTFRRALPYARPHYRPMAVLLLVTALNAGLTVLTPILFKVLIDDGITAGNSDVVLWISLSVVGLALVSLVLGMAEARYSGRVSEGLVYDLRTEVFDHVQRQPLAFFTRAQTGALVSRLNTDVVGAQQAVTAILSTIGSSGLTLILVLVTMFYLSWQVTLISLLILPLLVVPGKIVGRSLQRIMREQMQMHAEMGSLMNERFNVTGALLSKLYGKPAVETQLFAQQAAKVRDLGVLAATYGKTLFLAMTLIGSLATALVYGVGGGLAIDGTLQLGTLVALATLLTRLFGPITQLSSAQASILTALVSFDRLFEVLDLKPLITDKPNARALPAGLAAGGSAPEIRFDRVAFRYPSAAEVSLASLESIAVAAPKRTTNALVLREVSFVAPAGKLTALVGPSGAGKTTITHLVPRLYDVTEGAVRIGGHDVRDLTLASLHESIGIVTQDAHLFHATIRANLTYARPEATDQDLIAACRAAQIWDLIAGLPEGFDTTVGDRGYRLSGGEKQRIAIARLLLKAPPIVVLDEATAHLDSESEAALQKALKTALAGRTSLVIAHRLSTIREADQILVIDDGRVQEHGTHDELLDRGGLYAELYRTQFSRPQTADDDIPAPEPVGVAPGPLPGGPGRGGRAAPFGPGFHPDGGPPPPIPG